MMSNDDRATVEREPALERLNKYRLLAQLGRGGMAEVFLARAEGIRGFQRLLVVKRILPQLAGDPEFVRMFLDEARIAATLHHTNIVQVHEVVARRRADRQLGARRHALEAPVGTVDDAQDEPVEPQLPHVAGEDVGVDAARRVHST